MWKDAVHGRRKVGKLNIDGDDQGDLHGQGGEHRAVLVYQIDSYRQSGAPPVLRSYSLSDLPSTIHAARLRPDVNSFQSPTSATSAVACPG